MSDAPAKVSALPATLELAEKLSLQGNLQATEDGRLQLIGAKLLRGENSAGALSLRAGAQATLRSAQDDLPWRSDDAVGVTVAGVEGKVLILQISDTYSAAAKNCLLALSQAQMPGTTASAGDGTTDNKIAEGELLADFTRDSLREFEQRFSNCLADMRTYLIEMTLRAKGGDWRQKHHDIAADAIKGQKQEIVASMMSRLREYFEDFTPAKTDESVPPAPPPEDGALGLVDIDEFEHDLAVERLTKSSSELFDVPLEALVLRLAELTHEDPRRIRLPIHVAQLCNAFNDSLHARGIPNEVGPDVFDFFDKHLIQDLGSYYATLNNTLAKAGVLPEIETELREKGSRLRKPMPLPKAPPRPGPEPIARQPERATVDAPPAPAVPAAGSMSRQRTASHGSGETGAFADKLYHSLIEAMSLRRAESDSAAGVPAAGVPAAGGVAGSSPADSESLAPGSPSSIDTGALANPQSMAAVLGSLQRDSAARNAVSQGTSLREYLAANRENIDGLDGTTGLAADTLNQLNLVDNLFGTINSRLGSDSELRPALGDLQIPLAKLAMLEPQFMLNREHAARGVVDQIAQLATTGSFPNKALEGRVHDIVEEIVDGYDQDSQVFANALDKIDKLVEQQERALSRNVERVIRTQEGQEKLRRARIEVSNAIAHRIRPPTAPGVLLDLIDNGWRDLLVLTHIKEGPESNSWHEQLVVLDVIGGWLEALQDGSATTTELAGESGPFIDRIGQQLAAALPTNVAYRETLQNLKSTLSGERPVTLRQVTDIESRDDSGKIRARVDDLPRLKRWVKRVEQLESGNWLSYQDKEGVPRRMQLAWVSEGKDRYIFVNERGQKSADLSAIQLARQLSRGVKPPAAVEGLGLVDRSMYETLEQLQKTLSFARNHDSLTRLINRETFLDQLGRALRHAQTRATQHAVLYLDIDQFRLVNDLYDRVNGDQILLEFGKLLAQLHGKKTSTARIDGDEFAVLLLDRNHEQALDFAEKIRQDIESSSVEIEGEDVSFTVSIGIAPVLEHSPAVEEVLESARSAMKVAKENGRNQVVPFTEDQALARDYRQEQTRTRRDLEQALETERFVLRAQPIMQTAVDSGEMVKRHFELLLGWRDKAGAITSPGEFIRSAERYGFMTLVDRWVIKEAFSWISQLMDDQKVVPYLSINLSGGSITEDSFMEFLFEQISEFGVGTNRICFEITEAGTISNMVKAADFVRAFRNIGCKFSIDDFGTGLASHDFLRELPVDFVKIDGTFIKEIDTNQNDYAMARSINDLAHLLGQETIAESVENEDIVNKLREIGVDYLQGWEIGKPRPLAEIAGELSSIEK